MAILGLCGHVLKPRGGKQYCSRSCAMKAVRARQTVQQRSAMGRHARASVRQDDRDRMLARCMVFGGTMEARLLLAYQFGRHAKNSAQYRERQKAVGAA